MNPQEQAVTKAIEAAGGAARIRHQSEQDLRRYAKRQIKRRCWWPWHLVTARTFAQLTDAQRRVHELADEAQVLVLRQALAAELLQEIDPTGLPHEAAEQIRIAREALIRGGEEVTA